MKSYLTEADAAVPPSEPASVSSSTVSRRPFKLLQNIQQCHDALRSKMAASSSALRSITNRQQRTSAVATTKSAKTVADSLATRNRISTTRQKNALNGNGAKAAPVEQKNSGGDGKESSNAVGSLTSSPKWSHIKNKFENGPSVEKNKLSRTSSLNSEESEPSKMNNSDSKSLASLAPDTKMTVSRFKVVGRKETSSNILNSKGRASEEKCRADGSALRNVQRLRTRSRSPKNSSAGSRIHSSSSKVSKNSTPSWNSSTSKTPPNSSVPPKNSHQLHKALTSSSVSLSSNSSKNSEVDDPNSNSSSVSCGSAKNIPSGRLNGRSSPKSSLTSNAHNNALPKNIEPKNLASNISSLHSGLNAKKRDAGTISTRLSPKTEVKSKPISNTSNETSQSDKTQTKRKSLFSEKDRQLLNNISNINKSCRNNDSSDNNSTATVDNHLLNPDSVERIRELVKNSQPSTKTVWVKDNAGNWVKKGDTTDSKCSVQSKVAKLRSKFLETSEENNFPVSKSTTTNNVPAKTGSQYSRPLAKSSTTSSICDKTFSDDLDNDTSSKANTDNASQTHGKQSCDIKNTPNSKLLHPKRNSVDSDAKLNIVQRAILSYEGNLALLSPETQRRLKLVNDKVQAQTDDDKILQAKAQTDGIKQTSANSSQDNHKHNSSSCTNKKPDPKVVGEPVIPTREFLSRFHLMNRDLKKSPNLLKNTSNSKEEKKEVLNGDSAKSNGFDKIKITEKSNGKSQQPDEKYNRSDLTVSACGQNRENLTLNLSGNQLSVTTSSSQGDTSLMPNSSFLWRQSSVTSNELSKNCTTSSVSLTSSDYRNYYDIQNYYSTLDLEIEKRSENSEEPLYIDSQESNSSDNYASSSGPYQNVPPKRDLRNNSCEEWTDISDDDYIKSSISNNQSNTVKRKKNKRNASNSQKPASEKIQLNDTISFTDSNDTLINDEIGNESTFELSDTNHFYEPVYESLGNYLINQEDDREEDNCSISLSPDDQGDDSIHCSLTSLESAEDAKQVAHQPSDNPKKSSNKISQLRRHLSWTKNDIRLELSSKFNKIKIKKNNGQNATEIGVKVQEESAPNTSPKKKTFIKCILRQKSSSSIPLKRSPSPKKESSSHFYVHLSMESEKQRPMSDTAIVQDEAQKPVRKQSEPSLQFATKQQRPRFRKVASGPTVQRPKTPPPLPPNFRPPSDGCTTAGSGKPSQSSKVSSLCSDSDELDSHLYTCLDPQYVQRESSNSSVFYDAELGKASELKDSRLLVGAPKAQTNQPNVTAGGAVYRCGVEATGNCDPVPFDRTGPNSRLEGGRREFTDDKSYQWFGATVETAGESGLVLACAPRYVYFFTNRRRRDPVGTCWIARNSMADFQEYSPCRNDARWGFHRQGYCQAGMSAALTEDGRKAYVGAPGSWYWQGQVHSRDLISNEESHTRESPASYDDSFLGYSTAAGEFDGDSNIDVVVGMPRGNNLTGKAVLFSSSLRNLQNITGEQMGSYYGYSVCVSDVNGDGLDDIVVGAPFFTDLQSKESKYEEGRVYIHYQSAKHYFEEENFSTLDGMFTKGRFGLSLAGLKDINNDGFQDFAVGAPYAGKDGRGIIYIYHGSSTGVRAEPSQIITPDDFPGNDLRTLGFSLSGSMDMDANSYPDIAIGAYDSDRVIFMRSRPVVNITSSMKLSKEVISLDDKTCTLKDKTKVTCVDATVCLQYNGLGVASEIDLKYTWMLDANQKSPRALFFDATPYQVSNRSQTIRLRKDVQYCNKTKVFIQNAIRDKLTPIEIKASYELLDLEPYRFYLKPILNLNVPTAATNELNIEKNCGQDEICIPDLQLFANSNVEQYSIGTKKRLELGITIRNGGEDAFESMLFVTLPPDVNYVNIDKSRLDFPVSCSPGLSGSNLKCDIGNPLPANKLLNFTILLEPSRVVSSTSDLVFHMNVNSTNAEKNETLFNNVFEIELPVRVEVALAVRGVSLPEVVTSNKSVEVPEVKLRETDIGPEVTHIYEIGNQGPSSIMQGEVYILWPTYTLDGKSLLYLMAQPEVRGNAQCETIDDVNPLNLQEVRRRPKNHNATVQDLRDQIFLGEWKQKEHKDLNALHKNKRTKRSEDFMSDEGEDVFSDEGDAAFQEELSCGPTLCTKIHCTISTLEKGDQVIFSIRSRLWRETYNDFGLSEVKTSSKLVTRITSLPYGVDPSYLPYKIFVVSTKVSLLDVALAPYMIPWWIIILAVCIGLLLLGLLALLLWKLGFFKRKRPQEVPEKEPLGSGERNGYRMSSGDAAL